ncbi:hypothetical protein BXP70_27435 [Hymenobacter crusticola]|uniref:Ig-like domain-containing protein n=1 Tax=Hymenobacter crusticola TaxID=1770526 RepID=A0A243W760_9BACT|nr:hypothetical protein BXP70_27435 [Hymenobacter crusticola]
MFGLASSASHAQTPAFDLAVLTGLPPSVVDRTSVNDVAVDAAGNIYVTGAFEGTVRFGSTTLKAPINNRIGTAYVAKLDARGTYLWAVQCVGNGSAGTGISVDAAGNSYVTGFFTSGTAQFGSLALTNTNGADIQDLFVAKLSPTGQWQWATRAGGTSDDLPAALVLDPTGSLYLTGSYGAEATFGSTVLPSAGLAQQLFVAKLSTAGHWQWAVSAGGSANDAGNAVTVDGQGGVYIAGGSASATSTFGAHRLTSPSAFVAALTPAGAFRWVQPVGGQNLSNAYGGAYGYDNGRRQGLVADQTGHLYLSGSFFDATTRFGSFTLTNTNAPFTDGFVAQLDTSGQVRWAFKMGGTGYDRGGGVDTDATGSVYVTGTYSNEITLGATVLRSPNANNQVFVAKLEPTGQWRWALQATSGGPGIYTSNESSTLAIGPGSAPVIGGKFGNALSFGPGLNLQGQYAGQGFVARVLPAPALQLQGDSLLCNGGQLRLTAVATATATSYRWSTGATTPSILVTQPGLYTVTVTFAGGMTLTASQRVQVLTPTVTITGNEAPLCPGGRLVLQAQTPGARRLHWNTGATTALLEVTQPGTYTVTAEYGSGCAATAQVTIRSNTLTITGRSQLCPGQGTTLSTTSTGAAITSYRWNTGATTPTLRITQAGRYSVTATYADGCQARTEHVVTPPRAQVAYVAGDTLLCPGTQVLLTARNPDALAYHWNTGARTPELIITTPGLYTVELTYEGGCRSRDSLRVQAAAVLPAFTLGADTTLCAETPLVLRAPLVQGPGVMLQWSDGSTADTLLVQEAGLYSLRITTPCTERTVGRQVTYRSCLFAPNIITPNGDGLNDAFRLQGLTRGRWALEIYSRWGQLVFRATDYHNDWGAEAPPGVYYYLLQGPDQTVRQKGWVQVVR